MARARRSIHVVGVLGAAMLVATGCGGGGETVAPPADAGTPTPGATTPGGTVGATDPLTGAPAATDPVTGLPVDPAAGATDSGTSATVPELVGDDVSGGLAAVSDTTPIFDAQAVKADELEEQETDDEAATDTSTDGDSTTTTTAAVTYTGAKIYVDGIVHSVNRNGTFPKGNPVFRLLSVSASDIEIALVAGEFTSSGGDGTFLDKGDLVSMVNSSEQVTYRVKYLRPITGTDAVAF